jgi:hypothetical protein
MKKILLISFIVLAVVFAFAFEVINQFTDFETKNFKNINVSTSSIQDKIILLHTISSKSPTYKEDILLYKELQDVYIKAFFDRYAKKGLVVITLTDKIVDEKLIPNADYTFISNNKVAKDLIKKYNLPSNGGNLIINGKREIVQQNVPANNLKLAVGSLLTRDRLEINYFD